MISNWAIRSGLAVNLSKTEMVYFTRMYKITDVPLPSFRGVRVQPVDKVEYLGRILDGKLSCSPNLRKATIALYCNREAIGKRLLPKLVVIGQKCYLVEKYVCSNFLVKGDSFDSPLIDLISLRYIGHLYFLLSSQLESRHNKFLLTLNDVA